MKIIRSNYRDRTDDQFEMYIVGEDEENYYVEMTEEWKDRVLLGDNKLRKCLVGDEDNLYSIIEKGYMQVYLEL